MGTGLTIDGYRLMGEANDAKFSKKRRFGKLVVGDKKGKETEGWERRWGGLMDTDFYQRAVL